MAGLGIGCPGAKDCGEGATWSPPECAGSEARCIDWLWSWRGWMIDVLRAGTLSGVGMVSPVGGGQARTGMAMERPPSPPRPGLPSGPFCLAML